MAFALAALLVALTASCAARRPGQEYRLAPHVKTSTIDDQVQTEMGVAYRF